MKIYKLISIYIFFNQFTIERLHCQMPLVTYDLSPLVNGIGALNIENNHHFTQHSLSCMHRMVQQYDSFKQKFTVNSILNHLFLD